MCIRDRYDGYHFGNADIYCPWDVINFAKKLGSDPSARPSAFWINSSGNDMVKRFVDKADQTTRDAVSYTHLDVYKRQIHKLLRFPVASDQFSKYHDPLNDISVTTKKHQMEPDLY